MRRYDHVLSIKKDDGLSDLNFVFSCCLECEIYFLSPIEVKFRMSLFAVTHRMNLFLFLLFLCKFLVMVPNFWM